MCPGGIRKLPNLSSKPWIDGWKRNTRWNISIFSMCCYLKGVYWLYTKHGSEGIIEGFLNHNCRRGRKKHIFSSSPYIHVSSNIHISLSPYFTHFSKENFFQNETCPLLLIQGNVFPNETHPFKMAFLKWASLCIRFIISLSHYLIFLLCNSHHEFYQQNKKTLTMRSIIRRNLTHISISHEIK